MACPRPEGMSDEGKAPYVSLAGATAGSGPGMVVVRSGPPKSTWDVIRKWISRGPRPSGLAAIDSCEKAVVVKK